MVHSKHRRLWGCRNVTIDHHRPKVYKLYFTTRFSQHLTFQRWLLNRSFSAIQDNQYDMFNKSYIFHSHPPGNDHISPSKGRCEDDFPLPQARWDMDSFPGGHISYSLRPVFSLTLHVGMPTSPEVHNGNDVWISFKAALQHWFFCGGDGGDANWKYLKEWLHRWWFQIYTLRIYFLPMGFITIVGEYFWICCPTTKQANLRDVEHVETSFRFQWRFDLCFFQRESWRDWADDPGWFFSASWGNIMT